MAERYRQTRHVDPCGLSGEIGGDFAAIMAHKNQVLRTGHTQHANEQAALEGGLNLINGRAPICV